jgi:hypothetical protein
MRRIKPLTSALLLACMLLGLVGPVYAAAPAAASFSTAVPVTVQSVIQLQGSDADGTSLTYATTSGPSHGALSNLNTATGAVVYTPTAGYTGSDSFTYTVTSGGDTSSAGTVTITVTAAKTRVIDTFTNPDGTARSGKVTFILTKASSSPSGLIPAGASVTCLLSAAGQCDVSIYPSRAVSPVQFYQVLFNDSYGNSQLLGLYDIPASTTTITLAGHRITDTNLQNQFVFASKAEVDALTAAVATATINAQLLGSSPTNNALQKYDSGTGKLSNSGVSDDGTTITHARNTSVTGNLSATGTVTAAGYSGIQAADVPNLDASKITTGTLSNSRTTATAANTPGSIVARDANGDFTARNVTATTFTGNLVGNVTGNLTGNITGSTNVGGTLTATNLVGNGAGITGLTGATGGVSNTGSTTIRADSDNDGVGVIDLQAKNAGVGLRVNNDGSVDVTGGLTPATTGYVDAKSPLFGLTLGHGVSSTVRKANRAALQAAGTAACASTTRVLLIPDSSDGFDIEFENVGGKTAITFPCDLTVLGYGEGKSVIYSYPDAPTFNFYTLYWPQSSPGYKARVIGVTLVGPTTAGAEGVVDTMAIRHDGSTNVGETGTDVRGWDVKITGNYTTSMQTGGNGNYMTELRNFDFIGLTKNLTAGGGLGTDTKRKLHAYHGIFRGTTSPNSHNAVYPGSHVSVEMVDVEFAGTTGSSSGFALHLYGSQTVRPEYVKLTDIKCGSTVFNCVLATANGVTEINNITCKGVTGKCITIGGDSSKGQSNVGIIVNGGLIEDSGAGIGLTTSDAPFTITVNGTRVINTSTGFDVGQDGSTWILNNVQCLKNTAGGGCVVANGATPNLRLDINNLYVQADAAIAEAVMVKNGIVRINRLKAVGNFSGAGVIWKRSGETSLDALLDNSDFAGVTTGPGIKVDVGSTIPMRGSNNLFPSTAIPSVSNNAEYQLLSGRTGRCASAVAAASSLTLTAGWTCNRVDVTSTGTAIDVIYVGDANAIRAYDGTITLRAKDAGGITVNNGTKMKLRGATNKTLAQYETITLQHNPIDDYWEQVAP